MFQRRKLTAQMSQELIELLTDGGRRDLRQLRMDDLEEEVYGLVDEITQRTLRGVVEDQAQVCPSDWVNCPKCGQVLVDKPPEEKSLLSQRGEIVWRQPVKRCTACRCDFFPSSQSVGD